MSQLNNIGIQGESWRIMQYRELSQEEMDTLMKASRQHSSPIIAAPLAEPVFMPGPLLSIATAVFAEAVGVRIREAVREQVVESRGATATVAFDLFAKQSVLAADALIAALDTASATPTFTIDEIATILSREYSWGTERVANLRSILHNAKPQVNS